MKKLFFTLCALCLSTTMMWADSNSDQTEWTDADRTAAATVYQDATSGFYFYVTGEGENAIANLTWSSTESNYQGVTSLTIPESVSDGTNTYPVTRIGSWAFHNAPFKGEVTIPANILNTAISIFNGCTGITTVTYEYSATALTDENAGSSSGASGIAFSGCTDITTVNLYRDITISSNSRHVAPFDYLSIKTIVIGEYVTKIPNYMFRPGSSNTDTETVTSYAENPPTLGSDPFGSLSKAVLYTPYDYLNNYRLDSSWLSLFGPDNMHAIGNDGDPEWPTDDLAFYYEGLWYDPILDEDGNETGEAQIIKSQDENGYSGTPTIPATTTNEETGVTYNVTRIDEYAFDGSSISGHLVIPSYITNLGTAAFRNCTGLTEVTYEYSATPIYDECPDSNSGDECFFGCSKITTVNLYRDVTLAGGDNTIDGSFAYHAAIDTINIGPRVSEIPHHMFNTNNNSYSLKTINCYAAVPPTLGNAAFRAQYINGDFVVNVPSGAKDAYLADTGTYGWATMFAYADRSLTLENHIAEMSNAYAVGITYSDGYGNYYATYYNSNGVDIYPQGGTDNTVTTYAIPSVTTESETAYVNLTEVGATVPATTAVLVETNAAATYTVIETTAAGSASYNGSNCLYGLDTAGTITGEEGYYYYILTYPASKDNGTALGFYWATEDGSATSYEFAAHKAYLKLEKSALENVKSVALRKGEGDTTGITTIEENTAATTSTGIYTVQGVRVSNMNKQGLYIVDGKKVLVK